MTASDLGLLFTLVTFGLMGGWIAARRRRSAGPRAFALLLGLAFLGGFVGVRTVVFGVGDFRVVLSWAIVAACLGACVVLAFRGWRASMRDA